MIGEALQTLLTSVGMAWLVAVAASFIASSCEAANSTPKSERKSGPFAIVAGVASLITPFLLLIHAYWSVTLKRHPIMPDTDMMMLAIIAFDNIMLTAIVALFAVLTVLPMLPGLIIRKASPALGANLHRASPILHLLAFAIAVYATHESVRTVLAAWLNGTPAATP